MGPQHGGFQLYILSHSCFLALGVPRQLFVVLLTWNAPPKKQQINSFLLFCYYWILKLHFTLKSKIVTHWISNLLAVCRITFSLCDSDCCFWAFRYGPKRSEAAERVADHLPDLPPLCPSCGGSPLRSRPASADRQRQGEKTFIRSFYGEVIQTRFPPRFQWGRLIWGPLLPNGRNKRCPLMKKATLKCPSPPGES